MRRLVLAACLLATSTAHAAPPSRTLDRATRLYDRGDYISATIELTKVIEEDSGDDLANREHAQLLLGEALFHLQLYGASLDRLEPIARDRKHGEHIAALPTLAALADKLGVDQVPAIASYTPADFDDASLDGVRDRLRYLRGRAAVAQGDRALAARLFGAVTVPSPLYPRARVALAVAQALAGDDTTALATLAGIPARSDASDHAALVEGWIHVRAKQWDAAIRAYRGSIAPAALWATSIARLHKAGIGLDKLETLATVPPDEPELPLLAGIVAADACTAPTRTRADALATTRRDAAAIATELARLIADDHIAIYAQLAPAIRAGTVPNLSARANGLLRRTIATPAIDRTFATLRELDGELRLLDTMDRAWLTTWIASEVRTATTARRAQTAVAAGTLVRERVRRLVDALAAIRDTRVVLPAGGDGLAVSCP